MDRRQRSRVGTGLILILVGAVLLAVQFVPELRPWLGGARGWPLLVVGLAAALFVAGLVTWTPGTVAAACVVGGIGGLLYYQNLTGDWKSWAYAWTLLPGFSGVGTILAGLMGGQRGRAFSAGLWQIMISLLLFMIFASFLRGPDLLGPYWPILVIALGLLLLVRTLFRSR